MHWKENNFLRISPDNPALRYLADRIQNPNYRGSASSQHNRYTWEDVYTILKILDEYAPNKSLLSMRTTDISKRTQVNPDERRYTEFCERCKQRIGIGTPDAMRKNLFPDFDRMNLINRYDSDKNTTDPYDIHARKKYVSLTDTGLRFVRAPDNVSRHYIFSKCVNELLEGRIDVLLNIFDAPEYDIKRISLHEYTLFISAIGTDANFGLTTSKAVELLNSYRSMSRTSRKAVIDILKRDLTSDGNMPKPERRDFHNWCNKTQQIFHLLSQTTYFDVVGDNLVPIDDIDSDKRLARSLSQKQQYFKEHNVRKQRGFELHHVVPLSHSECKNHFKLLDTWKNMIYIDGFTHAKITQNRSKNVIMKSTGDDLELLDYVGNKLTLKHDENAKYAIRNRIMMLNYNGTLLEM